ncbi:cytochrome P450 [Phlyctochytrium arcticum]|nr:cytochrome P450 [Phlyctochytrium arcticum]
MAANATATAIAGYLNNAAAHLSAADLPKEKIAVYAGLAIIAVIILFYTKSDATVGANGKPLPPHIPHAVPLLGKAVPYGIDPIGFLQQCIKEYGNVFTFTMMGRKMTFCLEPEGNHFVFNVKLANATAEGAYRKLTAPVFGSEVVYDVENAIFMEQKKFVKDALTTSAFKSYVPIIAQETLDFIRADWKADSNQKLELFPDMAELTIRTASHCLMGKEIRSQLHSNVAKLFHDLDQGLQPINVFFQWLPLPAYFARDRANKTMTQTFLRILEERRAAKKFDSKDVLQALMDGVYRDGSKMSDEAIAHMMIAALMAGQHTSSTTVSWLLFELAGAPEIVKELLAEQATVLTGEASTPTHKLPDLTYEHIRQMPLLEACMKESLRLHTPIHTVMRLVEKDLDYKGFTIPAGHFLCGSQAVSQMDPTRFPQPEQFQPKRFLNSDEGNGEWTLNGVDIAQKSARSHFLPFGAGRHRCIGEAFAYVQIKTIVATMLREFEFSLPVNEATGQPIKPEPDYTSLIVMPKKPSYIQYKRKAEFIGKA